jgi:site-specific DNA recombinase
MLPDAQRCKRPTSQGDKSQKRNEEAIAILERVFLADRTFSVRRGGGRGHRSRRGKTFGVGTIHRILTNSAYLGRWRFNQKFWKTRERKSEEEVVEVAVPSIVDEHLFARVQRQLHARSPKVVPPRVTTGPILLTGLAICATCRGGMMLRTGTSENGRVYRYYTCSNCATKGKSVCKGRSIPMDKLDRLVTDHLMDRLFEPERLSAILTSLSARRAAKAENVNGRLIALQKDVVDADDKLSRLYRLVEEGLTDVDDVLQDRLTALKAGRDRAKAALERTKELLAPHIKIDPALIERFGRLMRENFTTGSVPFRKAYLHALIDCIEIDERSDQDQREQRSPGEGGHSQSAGQRLEFADEY